MASTKFIFNRASNDNQTHGIVVPPRPAEFALAEEAAFRVPRHNAQMSGIDRIKGAIQAITPIYNDHSAKALNSMFGIDDTSLHDALRWAYRCFKVDGAKKAVSQPIEKIVTQQMAKNSEPTNLFQEYIYLFNVLVAFEWHPSEHNVLMMQRAAMRAADFLFDVTNGWMTFGQVLIGGPDMMDCADIQVLASNRLMPRSWVGALHEPHKYIPIRVGRGLWQKNSRGSIPWDEPEGYRTLVHEWAHYALELRDNYTETHMIPMSDATSLTQSASETDDTERELTMPLISQPVESIMSTLEGTSELTAKQGGSLSERKASEWDTIIDGFDGLTGKHPRFPLIKRKSGKHHGEFLYPENIDGPLPIRELPHVAWVETQQKAWAQELLLLPSSLPALQAEHCWVYILKKPQDTPAAIIAQGTFDARIEDGFRLFGAEAGDDIVLIGDDDSWHQRVQRATIRVEGPDTSRSDGRLIVKLAKEDWEDCTPEHFPIIDIIPEAVVAEAEQYDERTTPVHVNVSLSNGSKPEALIYLYPADYINAASRGDKHAIKLASGESTNVPVALDGHVLVKLDGNTIVIATYSMGGSTPTGSPVGGTPLTPGSSEGNLMIFFADRGEYPKGNTHHKFVRMVTTRLPGGTASSTSSGGQARSYAYTLCSNDAIPGDYAPTLSLFYDKRSDLQDGEAIIHRWVANEGWKPVASYRPEGAWYVAAPLDQTTAPNLLDSDLSDETPRVERYRLFLVPFKPSEESQ